MQMITEGLEAWNGQNNNSGVQYHVVVTSNPPAPGGNNTVSISFNPNVSQTSIANLTMHSGSGPNGPTVSAEIVFNGNIRVSGDPNLLPGFVRQVAKHEGGHGIGLDNADDCPAGTTIMHLGDIGIAETQITACDNASINGDTNYPAPTPTPPPGGGGGPPCPGNDCNEGSGTQIDNCSYGGGCPEGQVNTGSCCQPNNVSPIIIDVDGSGFHISNVANGVWFDFFGNGHKIKISWTASSSTNAFLVLDRNGNGQIDNGRELFGNLTPQPRTPSAHGFLALAEFDKLANGGNEDGQIRTTDAVFASLRLWQDANHNGVSEPSELHTLQQLGLKTIDLDWKAARRIDQYGNQFRYRAKVKDINDAQLGRWAWDVFLLQQ
jgi:hypothetical protein